MKSRNKACIWSPVDANPQVVEDIAFSCYAKHQTELDDIVNIIAKNRNGSINLDFDDLSEADIVRELEKKGFKGRLSLEA